MAKKTSAGSLSVDLRLGLAKLQQDTREATRTLRGLESSVQGIGKNFQKAFQAAGAITGFYAIKNLAGALVDLAEKGDRASAIEENFKKLGGSSTEVDKATQATLGLVGSFDLMATANQGLLAGVAGFGENFGKMGELATRLGDTLGGDVKSNLDAVTEALIKGKAVGLQRLGFTIQETKAFKDYADVNGLVADSLDKTQKKAAITAQAMGQIDEVISRMAKPTAGVADTFAALAIKVEDAFIKMGQGIDDSETLKEAFQELGDKVALVDWVQLGAEVAQATGEIIKLAGWVITLAENLKFIYDLASGKKSAFGELSAGLKQSGKDLTDYIYKLEQGKTSLANFTNIDAGDAGALAKKLNPFLGADDVKTKGGAAKALEGLKQYKEEIERVGEAFPQFKEQIGLATTELERLAVEGPEALGKTGAATEDATNKSNEYAKSLEKSIQAYGKLQDDIVDNSLKTTLEASIKNLDPVAFNSVRDALYGKFYEGAFEGLRQGIDAGLIPLDEAQDAANVRASQQISEVNNQYAEAVSQNALAAEEKLSEAHRNSVELYQSLFENAITGVTFDLESALKQVAVGFAAEMAAQLLPQLSGIFANVSSPQGFGGSIAKSILGEIIPGLTSGMTSEVAPALSDGVATALNGGVLTASGETIGASASSSLLAAAPAVGVALAGAAALSFGQSVLKNPHQGYSQYGRDSTLSTAGRGVAAVSTFGLSEVALAVLSLGAETNKQTAALKAFTGHLEEITKEIGGLSIFGKDGKLSRVTDIKFGEVSKTSDISGALDKFGPQARGVFESIADGLKEIYGITEDVGGQMALILGETLGGSIDNARLAVLQLGLSMEDFQKVFLKQAEEGAIRWSEYNARIAGIGEAFKPGLEGAKQTKQAFDNLIASGGRGIAAVKSIKDAAVEGLEAGLTTVAQLGERLLAEGANPEQVKALVDSATARGITQLDKLKDASNEVAGGIVGGMETLSKTLVEAWSEMEKQIDSLNTKLESIPDKIETSVNVRANIDPQLQKILDSGLLDKSGGSSQPVTGDSTTQQFANGGVISQRTMFNNNGNLAMAGESGLEAILPLTRVNGRLGVRSGGETASAGSQIVINVDARGADVGVERRVVQAIERMKPEIAHMAVEQMVGRNRRGGY